MPATHIAPDRFAFAPLMTTYEEAARTLVKNRRGTPREEPLCEPS
jgi:hypothetical protein